MHVAALVLYKLMNLLWCTRARHDKILYPSFVQRDVDSISRNHYQSNQRELITFRINDRANWEGVQRLGWAWITPHARMVRAPVEHELATE